MQIDARPSKDVTALGDGCILPKREGTLWEGEYQIHRKKDPKREVARAL